MTIATEGWFLAAARTIDGPPMSICSTHSSGAAPEATVCGERVEVGDDQVERLDAEVGELLDVGVEAAVGEDAGVHPRVQRLHPAVEALGEAGEVLDLGDREAEALDQGRRAAGRDQLDAGVVQAADEVLEPGLVVDRDQGAPDRDAVDCVRSDTGTPASMRGWRRAPRRSMLSRRSLPGGRPPAPVVCAPD